MNDIMFDLETMDNIGSSAIVSIGAVQCNLITGEFGDEYYRVVDLNGQESVGRTIDVQTMYWWLGQSDSARAALLIPGKILLEEMCASFKAWIEHLQNPKTKRIWGNGASFDNAIIRSAFKSVGEEFPIPYWQDRDMRTIVGFYPKSMQEDWRWRNVRKGTHHNALDDAKYQVKYCSHILQELGVEELY
jgi:hypothetical protein